MNVTFFTRKICSKVELLLISSYEHARDARTDRRTDRQEATFHAPLCPLSPLYLYGAATYQTKQRHSMTTQYVSKYIYRAPLITSESQAIVVT